MIKEALRSLGFVKCFGLLLIIVHTAIVISAVIGYGWEDIQLYVDKLIILRWTLPLAYGLFLLIAVPSKYVMQSLGGYFIINSVPNLIHNINLLETFGFVDILCVVLVFVYIVQLVAGLALLWKNNNLGSILLISVLLELMISFWNPIYIYRRDWGSFVDIIMIYMPDIFRQIDMFAVAYILLRPEFSQLKDTVAISDAFSNLIPFVTIHPGSYVLSEDIEKISSCIQKDTGWDSENVDDFVVAKSTVAIRIRSEKPNYLLLQKRRDGSLYVSVTNSLDSSYITGTSIKVESFIIDEGNNGCHRASFYSNDGKFIRLKIVDRSEVSGAWDRIAARIGLADSP